MLRWRKDVAPCHLGGLWLAVSSHQSSRGRGRRIVPGVHGHVPPRDPARFPTPKPASGRPCRQGGRLHVRRPLSLVAAIACVVLALASASAPAGASIALPFPF